MNELTLIEPPPELDDFTLALLAQATDDVLSTRRPMTAFGLVESANGHRALKRIIAGTLEESLMHARTAATADSLASRVGVAWDGYLTIEGTRTEAIYVEVSEHAADTSFVIAQRYARKGLFKKTAFVIGRPMLVDNGNLYA